MSRRGLRFAERPQRWRRWAPRGRGVRASGSRGRASGRCAGRSPRRRGERSGAGPGSGSRSLLPPQSACPEGAPAGAREPKLDRVGPAPARRRRRAARARSAGGSRDAPPRAGSGLPTRALGNCRQAGEKRRRRGPRAAFSRNGADFREGDRTSPRGKLDGLRRAWKQDLVPER